MTENFLKSSALAKRNILLGLKKGNFDHFLKSALKYIPPEMQLQKENVLENVH